MKYRTSPSISSPLERIGLREETDFATTMPLFFHEDGVDPTLILLQPFRYSFMRMVSHLSSFWSWSLLGVRFGCCVEILVFMRMVSNTDFATTIPLFFHEDGVPSFKLLVVVFVRS